MKFTLKKIATIGLTICLATIGLAGCSSSSEEKQSAGEPMPEEQQPHYDLVIGTESETTANLVLENGTNQNITGIQLKETDSPEYQENLMTATQVWKPGQLANVFFDGVSLDSNAEVPENETTVSSSATSASQTSSASDRTPDNIVDDLIFNIVYDIQFTTDDGSAFVLHQMVLTNLTEVEDAKVCFDAESGLGYLVYLEDGSEVETLEAEKQVLAAAEQAAAEAQAQADAQAQAQSSAATSASTSNNASGSTSAGAGTSTTYDSVSSTSGTSSSSPSQSEDVCIEENDIVFND